MAFWAWAAIGTRWAAAAAAAGGFAAAAVVVAVAVERVIEMIDGEREQGFASKPQGEVSGALGARSS